MRVGAKVAAGLSAATISAAAVFVGNFEGMRTRPYVDPVGILTVCFGETEGVKPTDRYTPQQCREMLEARLPDYWEPVRECLGNDTEEMPDTRKIALISFTYNVGGSAFCKSTLLRKLKAGDNRRPLDQAAVARLSESMKQLGLLQPISVYAPSNDSVVLVAGRHRLEAAKALEWEEIEAVFVEGSDIDRQMQEIAENLHRSDLTVQERSDQVARWVDLVEAKAKAAQVAHPGGKQPHEAGVSKASRELGLTREHVQRSRKIAAISPEAKEAARAAGFDDNQSKLLQVASEPPERQAAKVISLASEHPKDDYELSAEWRRSFERIWNKSPSPADRDWAKEWIDRPIMDQRFAG